MNRFPLPLVIAALTPEEIRQLRLPRRGWYRTVQPFTYRSEHLGDIDVPVGFVTDFASIPQAAMWFLDDDDPRILRPAVIHDFLYATRRCSREKADQILAAAMRAAGAGAIHRGIVWAAVRAFGWISYPRK